MPDRNTWRTPPELFNAVNEVFNFGVDLASDNGNYLCGQHYTSDYSAFLPKHYACIESPVWCNPPYGTVISGQSGLWAWVKLCSTISKLHHVPVCMLVPGDHGTAWYQLALKLCAIEIRMGPRVKFIPPEEVVDSSNPKPSTLFVFDGTPWPWHKDFYWRWKEEPLAEVIGNLNVR